MLTKALALEAGIEHRRDMRRKAKKGAFVLFGNRKHRIGMLLDISKRGLAFQYVTESGKVPALSVITIYTDRDSSLSLEALPCRIVYDNEVIPTVNNLCIRRCGIEFTKLSRYQSAHLKRLLLDYTMH